MNFAVLLGKAGYEASPQFQELSRRLTDSGHRLVRISQCDLLPEDVDILLSVGGDGTFLKASSLAAPRMVPVLGVNMGRLGFLSQYSPEQVVDAIVSGQYGIEDRIFLFAKAGERKFYALNEITVSRGGSSMLGIDVWIDGEKLPTYWADGLVVATPSGSTAYSLSVGGPVVLPKSKVLIVSPIAPHNLNVRPLVIPSDCKIALEFRSREPVVSFSADTCHVTLDARTKVKAELAQFSLKRVCLGGSNFFSALSEKLLWGEDKRNDNNENR